MKQEILHNACAQHLGQGEVHKGSDQQIPRINPTLPITCRLLRIVEACVEKPLLSVRQFICVAA